MDCKLQNFYKKPAERYAIWAWVNCFKRNNFDWTVEAIIDNYIKKMGSNTPAATLKGWYYNMEELYNETLKDERSN